MLTTSVSLPVSLAAIWRKNQYAVMRLATRLLRLQMHKRSLRRGVKRSYNRMAEDFSIVTTRFTEAEYDALHFAAAAMRVSVSWLVYQMICLWKKPSRRKQGNRFVTNYEIFPCNWGKNAGIYTEALFIWHKQPPGAPANPHISPVSR